jgi:hypothetical protein
MTTTNLVIDVRFVVDHEINTWVVDLILRTWSSDGRRTSALPVASGAVGQRIRPDDYLQLVEMVGGLIDQGCDLIGAGV